MPNMQSSMLFPRFKKNIVEGGFIRMGEYVVVAVSGGIDSMALLNLFLKLSQTMRLRLVVAHVNYGLRGRASEADEKLVRKVCAIAGIPCEVLKGKKLEKANLQDSARRLRYDYFKKVASKYGASIIVTAHHKDDEAETILLHLIRGAGPRGFSGIRPMTQLDRFRILRPLLFALRSDIEKYAKKHRVLFRSDATNTKAKYFRNVIRAKLMPELKKYNPKIVDSLVRIAKLSADDDDALSLVAREAFEEAMSEANSEQVSMKREFYENFPVAIRRRILRMAYEELHGSTKDLNADQIKHMDELATGPRKDSSYRLPAAHKFVRKDDLIIIQKTKDSCDR